MRDKAYVIKIDRGTIWVTPLLSDTCINCTHPVCTRRGTPFPVTNPLKLTVKTGDIIELKDKEYKVVNVNPYYPIDSSLFVINEVYFA